MMDNKDSNTKVLFYAGSSYGFRSLPIWHVFEASQVFPTILLAEKLDDATENLLRDKKFFPKLEKIIYVPYDSTSLKKMIFNNRALHKHAEEVIHQNNPDIVITAGIVYPFALYLRRLAKRKGALTVCPFSPRIFSPKEIISYLELTDTYSNHITFLPISISIFLSWLKKRIGHFIYYWMLPALAREMPFWKEPGCVIFGKISGRSADYYISFTKQDYNLALKDGMPQEKIYNLPNPYPEKYKEVQEFLRQDFSKNRNLTMNEEKKILTIMWPSSLVGIKKENLSFIQKKEMKSHRIKVMDLIAKNLKDWNILIKPHPNSTPEEITEVKNFESISSNIKVVNHLDRAEDYSEISDAIFGFAPSSVTIYTASLMYPEKIILSIDLNKELLGDGYKNLNGVEYINNQEKFSSVLKLISRGAYKKEHTMSYENEVAGKSFSNFVELIKYLFNKKLKLI